MSSFGVVVCLSLFVPSAYPAPAASSDGPYVLKLEGTETKNEEMRRLEMEKSVEYSRVEIDNIFKKLFLYINAHYSDKSHAGDLNCKTIEGEKDDFVFYKVKGKLFPKKKPIYVAATLPAVGFNKYIEITAKKNLLMSSHLNFNEYKNFSHVPFDKLKDENKSVIEVHNGETEPTNTNQLEEALSSTTKSVFLRNDTVKEITSTDVTKTSQHHNIYVDHSGYTQQEFSKNISQSLQLSSENEYELDNDNRKNTIDKFTIPYDSKTLSVESSQVTEASQPDYEFDSNNPGIQIHKYVTESQNTLYSSENKSSHLDSTSTPDNCCEGSSSNTTTSNVHERNLTKNGKETHNMSTYSSTTEDNELNLTGYSYPPFFTGFDKSQNKTEKDSDSPTKVITPSPSLSNASEKEVKHNHFISQSDSTSSTRPDQLTSHAAINSKATFNNSTKKDQLFNFNTPFRLKQNNLATEKNLQADYFQSSSVTGLSYTPSTVTDGNFPYSSDRDYKTNISSKTLNYSDTPLATDGNNWNYSQGQSKSFTLFTSSLSLNKTKFFDNLNISIAIKENTTPSVERNSISDLKSEANKDDALSTLPDDNEVTKSVIEKRISILNYNTVATEKSTFGESIIAPSTPSNSPHQTVSEVSSNTAHKDFQESAQSNKIESNFIQNHTIQNHKSEPNSNAYNASSPVDETSKSHYLVSGMKIITITDPMGPPTIEYSLPYPSSPRKINTDEHFGTVTSPSLNNFSHETSRSFSSNTASTLEILDTSNYSKGFFNDLQLEISNSGLQFQNSSTPPYRFNNSYFTWNTNFTTKRYHDEESTDIDKHSNKTYEKETNYSIDYSTVSLLYTVHNSTERQPVDFHSDSPESETTQIIHESDAATLPALSDYTNNIEKTEAFSKEKIFVTSSLGKLTSGLQVDKASIPLTTATDFLTDKLDENREMSNSNWIEESTTSAYEKITKSVYNSVTILTGSGENNSSSNFFLPRTSSSVGYFGFTDSTYDNSTKSGVFINKIDGNHTAIKEKEDVSFDDLVFHDTNSTFYSHWNSSSVPQPASSQFDNANITKGVTITSDKFYNSDIPKHLKEKPNQPSFDYVIRNKTEHLVENEANEHYDVGNSLIENTTTPITEIVEDEKVENITDPLSEKTEKLTSNNPPISANVATNQEPPISPITSSSENVYSTTSLFISSNGDFDSSAIEIATTEPNSAFPMTENVSNGAIVSRKNETRKTLTTLRNTSISVLDYMTKFIPGNKNEKFSYSGYFTTLFGINMNTDKTQTLTSEWNSSVLTTSKYHNLNIQDAYDEISSKVTTTEIQNNRSSENELGIETTTQRYAHLSPYSSKSDLVINEDGGNRKLMASTTVDSTKNTNFVYTQKYQAIVNITENANTTPTEKSQDTFKATPDSVTPMLMSNKYDDINDKSFTKKMTTNHEITSSEKNSETSSTSENRMDFEMTTQHEQSMPSFNNFTFLLPTTDYLTSYLPVRIHPLIVFSEI